MTGEITVRARYSECDPMGVVHHGCYLPWFEMGRTELLRSTGVDYQQLETLGIFLAVVSIEVRYKRSARYDDLLTVRTTLERAGHVKIEHTYELRRGDELLTTARSTLACVDAAGKVREVPKQVREPESRSNRGPTATI